MRHPQDGTGLSFQQTDHYERPTWPEEPGRQQKMLHREVQVTLSSGADGYSDADGQKALEAAVALAGVSWRLTSGTAGAGTPSRRTRWCPDVMHAGPAVMFH